MINKMFINRPDLNTVIIYPIRLIEVLGFFHETDSIVIKTMYIQDDFNDHYYTEKDTEISTISGLIEFISTINEPFILNLVFTFQDFFIDITDDCFVLIESNKISKFLRIFYKMYDLYDNKITDKISNEIGQTYFMINEGRIDGIFNGIIEVRNWEVNNKFN